MNDQGNILVNFIDRGRKAKCPPDPAYPDGKDVDISRGARTTCSVDLPYPAPQCGVWQLQCTTCGLSIGLTAAGRPDDPRRVKLPCKIGESGEYPRGKLNEDDEGGLTMAVSVENGVVRVDFGKKVSWIGFDPDSALAFASSIAAKALMLKGQKL